MKKTICFIICLFLLSCHSSPSPFEKWQAPSHKVKVLSTTPLIDDLVSRIGGERIQHLSLMDHSMDPHSYELVKGDDEKFVIAQVVFYNGLGLEHAASLKAKLAEHPEAFSIGDAIYHLNKELILHHQGQVDPHIWLDATIWEKAVTPIVTHLSKVDPEGSSYYENRGKQICKELLDLDNWIQTKLKSIPENKRYLVTSHDAFNYFTRRYLEQDGNWKDRFCAPEGLAPDGQLGFQDLQRVVNHLQKNNIRVLFSEINVSQDSLRKVIDICKEKGLDVALSSQSLFSDTLAGPHSNLLTYDEMMKHNTLLLCEEWSTQ